MSLVAVCNRAFIRLGSAPIGDLSETSAQAVIAAAVVDQARQQLIRAHAWNFAIERRTLPALAGKPADTWARAFLLPADCLRVLQAGDRLDRDGWAVEGGKVLSDVAPPLRLRYLADKPEPDTWDAAFRDAYAALIEQEIAYKLTGSATIADAATARYKASIAAARRQDAIENPPTALVTSSGWAASR